MNPHNARTIARCKTLREERTQRRWVRIAVAMLRALGPETKGVKE